MNDTAIDEWRRANSTYLMAALGIVRDELRGYVAELRGEKPSAANAGAASLAALEAGMPSPPMLYRLCRLLELSDFERRLLLLCAGRDLDPEFDYLFAAANGNPNIPYPTLRLALNLWPDGDCEALAPHATLSRWGLIEIDAGPTAFTRPLRLTERVLYYLDGVYTLDDALHAVMKPARISYESAAGILPGLEDLSRQIIDVMIHAVENGTRVLIQLCGDEYASKQAVASAAAAALHVPLYVLDAADIPASPVEQEKLARLWNLEGLLSNSILFIDCQGSDTSDSAHAAAALLERCGDAAIVATRDPIRTRRGIVRIDIGKPGLAGQIALWDLSLGDAAPRLAPGIDAVVGQFNLGLQDIFAIGSHVAAIAEAEPAADAASILWDACRTHARPRLEGLAERIEPRASWDDLVLPDAQYQTIMEISAHVRQRMKVYHHWGVAARTSRGLGISALFAGPSGTGKTLSAEVIAHELRLDLYHIDLSQVVSKYIGETEKNLRRIFDTAEEAGAVLLFDEADALFGKRSEVKDSHDRHANIEVSYLLQRMESYRGLAILTTNMKQAIDTAFLRRIRFVVNFPFPDASLRAAIWRRIYPAGLPTLGLDPEKLGRLNVAGGNIKNIGLNAAFLAADEGVPVQMRHLLRAARSEYIKLEKPLTELEIKDWVTPDAAGD